MTLNDVQRAALALFAARAAGPDAALEQMKAIAYCMRNRVKAGWYDGQWLAVIEHAADAAGNPPQPFHLDPNSRALQRLVADIDDIYYGARPSEQQRVQAPIAQRYAPQGGDLEDAVGKSCYWCWINQPLTPWFKDKILSQPAEHPSRAQMGLMALFE